MISKYIPSSSKKALLRGTPSRSRSTLPMLMNATTDTSSGQEHTVAHASTHLGDFGAGRQALEVGMSQDLQIFLLPIRTYMVDPFVAGRPGAGGE